MFHNEHGPAHFHATYSEFKASIEIETLNVLEGWLPRRALGLVLDWAELHQNELRANWRLARSRQALIEIAPLS